MLLYYSLAAALPFLTRSYAQSTTDLVGTWSTKSNKTWTGPSFFDPISDKLIEPERTGISYSFTDTGHYEESYFRAIPNPADPKCPSAIMQWQHGSYVKYDNGSLYLTPIDVDGRQLLSEPCVSKHSTYTRYNQSEYFEMYLQYTDPYHNIPRLDLYEFNGEVMQPLYKVFDPPMMLPTTTLNPLTSSTASSKVKRRNSPFGAPEIPREWKLKLQQQPQAVQMVQRINPERLWWVGLAMTGVGGALYLGPRVFF